MFLGIFQQLGAPEIILILVIVLLLFGSTRLPKLARSVGQASKEFRDGVAEGATTDDESAKQETKTKKPKASKTSDDKP